MTFYLASCVLAVTIHSGVAQTAGASTANVNVGDEWIRLNFAPHECDGSINPAGWNSFGNGEKDCSVKLKCGDRNFDAVIDNGELTAESPDKSSRLKFTGSYV